MPENHFLHHVILFTFREEASEALRREICDKFATLGIDCGGREAGILFWSAKENRDQRKGVHLVEIAIFRDEEAFERFKQHEKHLHAVELIKSCSDWWVGDIYEAFPLLKGYLT